MPETGRAHGHLPRPKGPVLQFLEKFILLVLMSHGRVPRAKGLPAPRSIRAPIQALSGIVSRSRRFWKTLIVPTHDSLARWGSVTRDVILLLNRRESRKLRGGFPSAVRSGAAMGWRFPTYAMLESFSLRGPIDSDTLGRPKPFAPACALARDDSRRHGRGGRRPGGHGVLREQDPPGARRALPGMPFQHAQEAQGEPSTRYAGGDSQGGQLGAGGRAGGP